MEWLLKCWFLEYNPNLTNQSLEAGAENMHFLQDPQVILDARYNLSQTGQLKICWKPQGWRHLSMDIWSCWLYKHHLRQLRYFTNIPIHQESRKGLPPPCDKWLYFLEPRGWLENSMKTSVCIIIASNKTTPVQQSSLGFFSRQKEQTSPWRKQKLVFTYS